MSWGTSRKDLSTPKRLERSQKPESRTGKVNEDWAQVFERLFQSFPIQLNSIRLECIRFEWIRVELSFKSNTIPWGNSQAALAALDAFAELLIKSQIGALDASIQRNSSWIQAL